MPLQITAADVLEREIQRRFELRGSSKTLTKTEKRKLETITASAAETAPAGTSSLLRAFVDHSYPLVTGRRFTPISKIYFAWQSFLSEVWPQIEHLFPIALEDEEAVHGFFSDWAELKKDKHFLRDVYFRLDRIGGARIGSTSRCGPDFFRVLGLLREAQKDEKQEEYPLFTLRAFLASQVESLSGFVGEFKIGNVVSEKAWDRYDEWYLYRYYGLEMAKKSLSRPSANNPASNRSIRVEFEVGRAGRGVRPADHTMQNETPVAWWTRPALYYRVTRDARSDVAVAPVRQETRIELPPGLTL